MNVGGTTLAGQLGDGTKTNRPTPTAVKGFLAGVVDIAAGGDFTCARTSTGVVHCWGANDYGQLGIDSTTAELTPSGTPTVTNAKSVATGLHHGCAILTDATLWCWGAKVPLTGVVSVAAGIEHTCAALEDGSARCWGANGTGKLGNMTFVSSSTPSSVVGATAVERVCVGYSHSCALLKSGGVSCWGANGLLGDGSKADRATASPTPISGARLLACGNSHAIAASEMESWSWGINAEGVLGSGAMTPASSETPVSTSW